MKPISISASAHTAQTMAVMKRSGFCERATAAADHQRDQHHQQRADRLSRK